MRVRSGLPPAAFPELTRRERRIVWNPAVSARVDHGTAPYADTTGHTTLLPARSTDSSPHTPQPECWVFGRPTARRTCQLAQIEVPDVAHELQGSAAEFPCCHKRESLRVFTAREERELQAPRDARRSTNTGCRHVVPHKLKPADTGARSGGWSLAPAVTCVFSSSLEA